MIGEYRKGVMGHMLDMRRAMGETAVAAREWCRAFDAGDQDALQHLGEIIGEVMAGLGDAAKALGEDGSVDTSQLQ